MRPSDPLYWLWLIGVCLTSVFLGFGIGKLLRRVIAYFALSALAAELTSPPAVGAAGPAAECSSRDFAVTVKKSMRSASTGMSWSSFLTRGMTTDLLLESRQVTCARSESDWHRIRWWR
jgi:hypothetical protein